VFDPDAEFTLRAEDLQYRHLVSPYLGETLHGKVQATFVRGAASISSGERTTFSKVTEWKKEM
ncbi:MAG: hypothetical protein QOI94_3511, partial [Acidobacteriaceae bacterium]|nr:hypothetical protein [Acidobacteriaceae bacterium]